MTNFTLGSLVSDVNTASTYVIISKVYDNKVNGLRIKLSRVHEIKAKQYEIKGMPIAITGMTIVVDCEDFESLNVDMVKAESNFLGITQISNMDLYKIIANALVLNNPVDFPFRRGNVILADLTNYSASCESYGVTPCLIISNNTNNYALETVTVLPLKKEEDICEFETGIPNSENNVVYLEDTYTVVTNGIRTICKSCVNEDVGVMKKISPDVMFDVSKNVATMLGLALI